jgi:hypothetical protein
MADRTALGRIGLTFLAVTMGVMLMAVVVTASQLATRGALEAGTPVSVASIGATVR